jgi:hypothetical protein
METFHRPSFLATSGTAFLFGIISALMALIVEVAFSLITSAPGIRGLFSEAAFGIFTLISIVIAEEIICSMISRSLWNSLQRWITPILLGVGFFLIESSINPILVEHTLMMPSIKFIPVLLIHISTFALYLSLRHFPRLSLGIGISIHLFYNLIVFLSASVLPPTLISAFIAIGMVSFFLARLDTQEYTESELN